MPKITNSFLYFLYLETAAKNTSNNVPWGATKLSPQRLLSVFQEKWSSTDECHLGTNVTRAPNSAADGPPSDGCSGLYVSRDSERDPQPTAVYLSEAFLSPMSPTVCVCVYVWLIAWRFNCDACVYRKTMKKPFFTLHAYA